MKKCNVMPRHLRLGLCIEEFPQVQGFQDVVQEIPIVDDDGQLVETRQSLVPTPADEVMRKYDYREFSLTKLTAAGVPLKTININPSRNRSISDLYDACMSMDNAQKYVEFLEKQQQERDSWFSSKSIENVQNVELNEIY